MEWVKYAQLIEQAKAQEKKREQLKDLAKMNLTADQIDRILAITAEAG